MPGVIAAPDFFVVEIINDDGVAGFTSPVGGVHYRRRDNRF